MGEVLIIDVSEGVGVINFSEVAKHVTGEYLPQIHGAIVRLTSGNTFDERGFANYNGFRSIGLPVGVYGWHNPSDNAVNNKNQAMKLVEGVDALPEYPQLGVWADYETDYKNLTFEQMRQAIWKYINTFEVEFEDVTLGIYTRKYWWDDNVANAKNGYTDIPKDRPLWASNPRPYPPPLQPLDWVHRYGSGYWVLWQYSFEGEISGCPGQVDYNTFNGNMTAFRQYFGLEELPPPPAPLPAPIVPIKRVKVKDTISWVNVREQPSLDATDLGDLIKGSTVPVVEINGDFYRIGGWIHKGYVTDV